MNESQDTHTSIRIALPRTRCGEVRGVVEILSALEDVYNHLYAWHQLAGDAEDGPQEHRAMRSLPDIEEPRDVIPADRRLCLARIEVEAPAFIEVVGARYPLAVIHNYLLARDGQRDHRSGRTIEKIDAVRAEIDHLWASNFSEHEIRQAVSTHVIAPFKRLERLEGIEIYEGDDTPKTPARRGQRDRTIAPLPMARGH